MTAPLTTYVDPGIAGSGLSVFAGTELLHAAYVPNPASRDSSPLARRVLMARALVDKLVTWATGPVVAVGVEDPKVRDSRHQAKDKAKADPNDLLNLTGVTTGFAALLGVAPEALYSVEPFVWKGTLDKKVFCARIWMRLTPEERARVERTGPTKDPNEVPKGLAHNAIDSVGLGLHFCGRLERVRVYAP